MFFKQVKTFYWLISVEEARVVFSMFNLIGATSAFQYCYNVSGQGLGNKMAFAHTYRLTDIDTAETRSRHKYPIPTDR